MRAPYGSLGGGVFLNCNAALDELLLLENQSRLSKNGQKNNPDPVKKTMSSASSPPPPSHQQQEEQK
jgi:hypothetical protein